MESKIINRVSSIVNRYSFNDAATTETTRWNQVFGKAQDKIAIQNTETRQAASSKPINDYAGNSSSQITSLNLGINPRVIDYEIYKSFNDLEKSFQEKGYYKAEDITNPYHYTKTNNYFKDDIRDEFAKVYGKWDGYAQEGKAFAYIDKYGNSGISENFFTALISSKDGKIYNFEGEFYSGYAIDARGNRMWLAGLEGSTPYSNFNPMNATDKAYIESINPNFFANADKKENDSYSDRFPYVNKSVDAISHEKFSLFNLPIYYGQFINNHNQSLSFNNNAVTGNTTNNYNIKKVSSYEW